MELHTILTGCSQMLKSCWPSASNNAMLNHSLVSYCDSHGHADNYYKFELGDTSKVTMNEAYISYVYIYLVGLTSA